MAVNADHGCNHSGILTESTSGYAETFATAAQSGAYDISFTEALLTAVTNGVEKPDSGECNEGFSPRRHAAHRYARTNVSSHPILVFVAPNGRATSTASSSQKGDPALVRISAVAGDPPSGRQPADRRRGQGYYESVQATGAFS